MVAFSRKYGGWLIGPKVGAIVKLTATRIPRAAQGTLLPGAYGRKTGLPGKLEYSDQWFNKSLYVAQPTAEDIELHASLAQRQALLYEKRLGLWGKVRRFFAAL